MQICSEGVFSLLDEALFAKAKAVCDGYEWGIYTVFSVELDETPRVIARLLDQDESGTLYIGASRRLPARMAELRKSVLAAYKYGQYRDISPHMVGRKIGNSFTSAFPIQSLRVKIRCCDIGLAANELQHFHDEGAAIQDYQAEYGETPPLNG